MNAAVFRLFALIMLGAFAFREAPAQHPAVSTATVAVANSLGADSVLVPILVYHGVFPHHPGQTVMQRAYDVAPEAFDAQMAYLRDNNFHVVSFSALVDALESGKPLAEKTVVITLDDGRENQYVHAFPILRKYGFTATFFVYPNPVDRVADFMTWDQIREIQKAGMTIGCHTQTHPYLTKVTDPRDMKREIEGSRAILEKQLGVKVDLFAYPFGLKNADVEAAVRRAGYRAARAFPGGRWQSKSTLFSLKGLQIEDSIKSFANMVEPRASAAPNKPNNRVIE
jgi:peptidoglycan/xylan/chitin deacetylase (PgdA/CDA1 family)